MVFVQRDGRGEIIGRFTCIQPGFAEESLPDDHPDLKPSREARLDIEIRPKRNALLDEVDLKYCNAEKWSDMTAAKKAEWRAYKQALKDLPSTIDPNNPIWPVMPA